MKKDEKEEDVERNANDSLLQTKHSLWKDSSL